MNRRPPAPKAGALTRLRYVPSISEDWRFGITGTGAMQDEKKRHRAWSIEHGDKRQRAEGDLSVVSGPWSVVRCFGSRERRVESWRLEERP